MKQPLTQATLDQLFLQARTYNGYLDKPVETSTLHAIWNLMRMGPTSMNGLPARIIWCASEEARGRLADLSSGSNGKKIRAAPVAVIIGMDERFHDHLPEFFPHMDARPMFEGNEKLRLDTAFRNSSLQGAYFILAARALGLDTGPMSGFDNAAVDTAFFADAPHVRSNFISTLGYGDPSAVRERGPRPDFDRFNRIF